MEDEIPASDNSTTSAAQFSSSSRNRLIIYIGIALLLNLVIVTSATLSSARHLNGTVATIAEVRRASILSLAFTANVLGFILGLVGALFPYKGLRYDQKYLRASLLAILGLQLTYLVFAIIGLLMR